MKGCFGMQEFKTRKMNVVKEMIKTLNCSCECRLSGDGQDKFEFVFPYTDEVFSAYIKAKNSVYDSNK